MAVHRCQCRRHSRGSLPAVALVRPDDQFHRGADSGARRVHVGDGHQHVGVHQHQRPRPARRSCLPPVADAQEGSVGRRRDRSHHRSETHSRAAAPAATRSRSVEGVRHRPGHPVHSHGRGMAAGVGSDGLRPPHRAVPARIS